MPSAPRPAAASKNVLVIQGHPDATSRHLLHALADAYADGARAAGHEVRVLDVARLDFPLLRSQHDWEHGSLPEGLRAAQQDIGWAHHLAIFFPLWLGDMPALLKGFLEQVARPGFAFQAKEGGGFGAKGLSGRSARVVVTMGMSAQVYRWFYRAHSVKSLERNILGFVGIAPVEETLIGMVASFDSAKFVRWSVKLNRLGAQAI